MDPARPTLQVLIGGARPGRIGPVFAAWFVDIARAHGGFEVEIVDLAEVNLPFMDEPKHPRLADYQHQHTREWSATVSRADAFVLVTPEYNHGYSPVLKNALDYLFHEWGDKAVGFLSYGGVAAGTRAVQQLKQVVTAMRMVPVVESVNVSLARNLFSSEGALDPTPEMETAAQQTLAELLRVTTSLGRVPQPVH